MSHSTEDVIASAAWQSRAATTDDAGKTLWIAASPSAPRNDIFDPDCTVVE